MGFEAGFPNARRVARWLADATAPLRTFGAGALEAATRNEVRTQTRQVLARLQATPPPPTYPLVWASAKQRRAYFATNGFGKGIPYRRTGNLSRGWAVAVTLDADGGVIQLTNDQPYARYVQGPDAQLMHIDTGWVQPNDIADEFQRRVYDASAGAFFDVVGLAEVRDVV